MPCVLWEFKLTFFQYECLCLWFKVVFIGTPHFVGRLNVESVCAPLGVSVVCLV